MVTEAFAAARELLRQAEEDAARVRADADRYARQREQEAELLIGKARRLLEVAELRAASLSVGAVAAPVAASVAAGSNDEPVQRVVDVRQTTSGLDRMLARAIANAVDDSFYSAR